MHSIRRYDKLIAIVAIYKTSQDPSSPMAGSSSNNGQVGVCNAITEVRDGWDNEEWGSLEEEPVNE